MLIACGKARTPAPKRDLKKLVKAVALEESLMPLELESPESLLALMGREERG